MGNHIRKQQTCARVGCGQRVKCKEKECGMCDNHHILKQCWNKRHEPLNRGIRVREEVKIPW